MTLYKTFKNLNILILNKPPQCSSMWCGVVLVSTGPQQLSQARHYDIYNIYNIETNNQQMWPTSTFRPAEGQQEDRHRFTFSLLANKLETSQISLFKVSSISTFRMSEIVMESLTGHRPHTFRNFPIYISVFLSIYLSIYLYLYLSISLSIYTLYLLLITYLQYWYVEI